MDLGLVEGEGFTVDASALEANASHYHGKPLVELDWTEKQRQRRAIAEFWPRLTPRPRPQDPRLAHVKGEDHPSTAASELAIGSQQAKESHLSFVLNADRPLTRSRPVPKIAEDWVSVALPATRVLPFGR